MTDTAIAAARILPDALPKHLARAVDQALTAYYPTSAELADAAIANSAAFAQLPIGAKVMEPSAGDGALIDAMRRVRPDLQIFACEIDPRRRAVLASKGVTVLASDCMELAQEAGYDAVVMNPPFATPADATAWLTHVEHAQRLLRPAGVMIAILPGGLLHNNSRRVAALRGVFTTRGAILNNPNGAFKAAGTNTHTVCAYMGAVVDASAKDVMAGAQTAAARRETAEMWSRVSAVPVTSAHASEVTRYQAALKAIQRSLLRPGAARAADLFTSAAPYTTNGEGHYCIALSHPAFGASLRVVCRKDLWELIESVQVVPSRGYFELVNRENGFTAVHWKYDHIIGGRVIALVETASFASLAAHSAPGAALAA